MIRHIFLDKCNTIIKNSENNTGLNPVVELNSGKDITRILLHFNLEALQDDITPGNKYILKMFNCGNVNVPQLDDCCGKQRASSFDVIAFKLPYLWDRGVGFDYNGDYFHEANKSVNKSGSNWLKCQTSVKWDEPGVYSYETLRVHPEYIITKQHFDSGLENLEMDITSYVDDIINNDIPNLGIGLMFSPIYETGEGYQLLRYPPVDIDNSIVMEVTQLPFEQVNDCDYILFEGLYYKWETVRDEETFVSFFGPETNTFFNPYIEVSNDNVVLDDRYTFTLGTTNKLYFFSSNNGEYFDLDELPICTIEGTQYPVKRSMRGIYYAEVKLTPDEADPNTVLYDVWSNIILNGSHLDDVEVGFVVQPSNVKMQFGKFGGVNTPLCPQLSGVNAKENLKIGDVREVTVHFLEEYSRYSHIPSSCKYRIYVKEGNREIDVFPYQTLERFGDSHTFLINTNDLIPNTYYVDMRVTQGRTTKQHNNILTFNVVSDVTNYHI